jgi:hypothetical protein
MRRILHENWPMILALAAALAIGWLVFTVLRPAPAAHTRADSRGDASAERAALVMVGLGHPRLARPDCTATTLGWNPPIG